MFSGPSPFGEILSYLSYAISGLMGIVCLAVIARAIFIPTTVRRGATCGGCGHELIDTSTNRCPECGGLLTKVGVATPAMAIRLRGGLGWALLAWTAMCGAGARYAFSYIQMLSWQAQTAVVNTKMQHITDTELIPAFHGQGFSGNDDPDPPEYRIDLNTTVMEDKSKGTSTLEVIRLTLQKTHAIGRAMLEVHGNDQTFHLYDGHMSIIQSGPLQDFGVDTLKAWYSAASLDPADPRIAQGMTDVRAIIDGTVADPGSVDNINMYHRGDVAGSLVAGGTSGSTTSMPAPTSAGSAFWGDRLTIISGATALIMYAAGAGLITWRHRRLFR